VRAIDKAIQLRDGRKLAYAEYGDLQGKPLFFFHGIPGSRVFRPPDKITEKMGMRLICVDRPGSGLSTFQPRRRILDWPNDIAQLANALGIERFAVAGHSGGGPYVAACAYALPERVTVAVILCGAALLDTPESTQGMITLNKLGFKIGRYIPWPLWWLLIWFFYHKGRVDPAAVMERDARHRPLGDSKLWERPEIRQVCYKSTAEGLRQGIRGHAWETRLITRPWGFQPEDIPVPVYLWYGEDDNLTPVSMGRYLASKIPNSKATFCEGEGHLLLFPHWEEILAVIRDA